MDQPIFHTLPKYKNKQEIAYGEIKNAIIQCRLRPGDALVIRNLAAQLNVSESPVREAMKRLISEKFVTERYSSFYVAPISADEFLDMEEVRLKLEVIAIQLSARKITDERLQYLKCVLETMIECCAENDFKSYTREHSRFHLECCLACGVSYLMSALDAAFAHHERGIHYFKLSIWKDRPSLQEHSDILNALANHDPEEARRCLCKNRERADAYYRQQMAELMAKEA